MDVKLLEVDTPMTDASAEPALEAEAERQEEERQALQEKLEEALSALGDSQLPSLKSMYSVRPDLRKARDLAQDLRSEQSYTRLDVHQCGDIKVLKVLAAAVEVSSVIDVRLLRGTLGEKSAETLSLHLQNSALRRLHITQEPLGPRGAAVLAAVLPGSLVTTLQLTWTEIGDGGAIALASALPQSRLRALDLNCNEITAAGARALAAALKRSSLMGLGLMHNWVGDAGAEALAEGLPGSNLRELRLRSCGISDEGARALAAVLKESMVQKLNLGGSNIGDLGGQALLEGVRDSPVTEVKLSHNPLLGQDFLNEMKTTLEANKDRSFVLQVFVQGTEEERTLTFKTMSGREAAALQWRFKLSLKQLQEAVYKEMRSQAFDAFLVGLSSHNIRFVWPDADTAQQVLRSERPH